jgi:Rrf2 family iron-sulfur cluster assembly transcriptional regulator
VETLDEQEVFRHCSPRTHAAWLRERHAHPLSHVGQGGGECRLSDKTEGRPAGHGCLLAGCGRVARTLLRQIKQEVAMIFSRTSQYAIQALIYLATQPSGTRVLSREVAQSLGVPSPYLAKILQDLSREKLLDSARGRTGGFSLHSGAEKTSLLDIVLMMERPRVDRECLLGLKVCNDETACPLHRKWKPVKKEILARLGKVTLISLAHAVQSGEYRLTDLPSALSQG